MGRHVIDRCNLTILDAARTMPTCRSSSPSTTSKSSRRCRTTAQPQHRSPARRGRVRRSRSQALRQLNALGYGARASGLRAEPRHQSGRRVPRRPTRRRSKRDWKRELQRAHGITFNRALHASPTCRSAATSNGWSSRAISTATWRSWCSAFNPGDGERPDVPRHHLGGLGRTPLRLRLQPDARSAGRSTRAADDHGPSYDSGPLVARRGHRPALLRLHRRRRIQLWRIDHGLKARL